MSSLPRRVLHVMNAAGGGAALSTLALMEAAAAEGIVTAAVCHELGTREEREQLTEAVQGRILFTPLYWWNRKTRAPLWRRPLSAARQILATGWARGSSSRVAQFAVSNRVDLIHTNTIVTPEGGLAARQLGLPHVWHLRELVGPGSPYRLWREGHTLGRYMTGHCSKVVANSQTSAQCIRAWLPDEMLDVVPNGIDISRFQPRAYAPKSDRIVVGMVGNVTSHWKKHALFISGAALVDRALPIEWRVYGHDPSRGGTAPGDSYTDGLRAQVDAAGLGERFRWIGFVSDPVEIMSELDLLVHPSHYESFGRIAVEAMAAGLPVVGVARGGLAEIVEHGSTGLLAQPDDARGLADCIEQLLRDPQRARAMGEAGRKRAESTYSLPACVAGVLHAYESAMARPLGRRGRQPATDTTHGSRA